MKSSTQDLSSLISAAQDEADRKEQPSFDGKPKASARRAWVQPALVAAGLVFAAIQLWPLARTHSADQTARDLDAIVEQARASLEATRTAQGRLPDVLPNAALAGLVAYTPAGNGYQLFAASGSVAVMLDVDGKKTITRGKQP